MSYWEWLYKTAWIALIVMALIVGAYLFWPRIHRYQEYRQRERELKEELRSEDQLIKHLRLQHQRLHSDARFLERLAHEQGMVKTNEVLFRVPEDEPF